MRGKQKKPHPKTSRRQRAALAQCVVLEHPCKILLRIYTPREQRKKYEAEDELMRQNFFHNCFLANDIQHVQQRSVHEYKCMSGDEKKSPRK